MAYLLGVSDDAARASLALYPAGDAAEAAQAAGLSPEEGQRELERLADLHLVERQAQEWRCTMPVVDETDMELIRLWAQPVADVVAPHLGALHREALGLSQQVQGDRAQSTVMAVAMGEAARRPFAALQEQLGAAAPERGRHGRFSAAVCTCEMPEATVLRGGYSAGHSAGDGRDILTYYLHPTGTRRPAVTAFLQQFDVSAGLGSEVRSLLHEAVHEGITPEVKARLADVLQIPADRRAAFWRGLAELAAIDRSGDPARVLVPVLPLSAWREYLGHLDAIGVEITQRVTDAADGLRRRAARCSFADCYFADAVLVFVACDSALVGRAIDAQGWVTVPAEADLSWGVLIAA